MIGRHDNYCGLPARPQQIRLGGPLPSAFLHAPSDAHMAADFGDAMHVPGEPEQNFIDAHVEQEELRAQLELLNQRKAACDKRCAALEAREELQEEKWRRVQLVAKESARSFYERAQGGSSTSSAGGPASADTSAWDLGARPHREQLISQSSAELEDTPSSRNSTLGHLPLPRLRPTASESDVDETINQHPPRRSSRTREAAAAEASTSKRRRHR